MFKCPWLSKKTPFGLKQDPNKVYTLDFVVVSFIYTFSPHVLLNTTKMIFNI